MARETQTREQEAVQELLRALRVKANLRQADIARKLGVPQSFVSKYESGERRLDILEVRELCRLFEISLRDFVRHLEKRLAERKL